MRAVSAAQMRALDEATMTRGGIPGKVLMERAGRGVADAVERLRRPPRPGYGGTPGVLLAAGKGNNGGDVFAAARLLHGRGWRTEVWMICSREEMRGDARLHLEALISETGLQPREATVEALWDQLGEAVSRGVEGVPDVVVDGLLGTGLDGPPRGVPAAAIRCLNAMGRRCRVLAIDLPSGMLADTGEAPGDCVRADLTVTLALPKTGLLQPVATPWIGGLEVVDIGIPPSLVDEVPAGDGPELISAADVRDRLPRREAEDHKGSFGHVLAMGGSAGKGGAIQLAGRGALRSGAGLVSLLVPNPILAQVSLGGAETMVEGGPSTEIHSLHSDLWAAWRKRIDTFDALVVGPGMTRHNETLILVRQLLRDATVPMVVDADAISVFAGQPHWFDRANGPLVLTPHPGELSRLFGKSIEEIQGDRVGMAIAAAKFTKCHVVLKGAGTLVADPEGRVAVNRTGNPGLATGGTGDVLAGMIGGFLAQGLDPFDAACAGVHLHGLAGDLAARSEAQASLVASDVLACLPEALATLLPR